MSMGLRVRLPDTRARQHSSYGGFGWGRESWNG